MIDLKLEEIDRPIDRNTKSGNTVETYLVGYSRGRFQLISEGHLDTPQQSQDETLAEERCRLLLLVAPLETKKSRPHIANRRS